MNNAPAETPIDITGKYDYDRRAIFRISCVLVALSVGVSALIALPVVLFVVALAMRSVVVGGLWLLCIAALMVFENRVLP